MTPYTRDTLTAEVSHLEVSSPRRHNPQTTAILFTVLHHKDHPILAGERTPRATQDRRSDLGGYSRGIDADECERTLRDVAGARVERLPAPRLPDTYATADIPGGGMLTKGFLIVFDPPSSNPPQTTNSARGFAKWCAV
jgi:hypothetical protein